MPFALWSLLVGGLLFGMALAASLLKRLPLTTSIVYLAVGLAIGPLGLGLLRIDPLAQAGLLEHLTEVTVIVSLFSAGLKLRAPLTDGRWKAPVRLASVSMLITVALITVAGVAGLGLSLGAALLLGAVLAPTDPVLASDVQVEDAGDRDRARFSLTGEAGLNDGAAFPLVFLGLGLLGQRDLGTFGWRWLAVDVLWGIAGGLGIGWLLGMLVGRLVLYLRREHRAAVGLDDFLALGLIGMSYGAALLAGALGFLAVFAAGLALRRIEARESGEAAPPDVRAAASDHAATDPEKAPAYMAEAVLGFNEQLERIGEVAVVVLVGALLATTAFSSALLWFVPLLLLVIRPAAALLGLAGLPMSWPQRAVIAWFGIRGIGSIYYLMYAIAHGLPDEHAQLLLSVTLAGVAVSVVVHGVSVTPLMRRYQATRPGGQRKAGDEGRKPAMPMAEE